MGVLGAGAAFAQATSPAAAGGSSPLDAAGRFVDSVPGRLWLALAVLVLGGVLSYLVIAVNQRILEGAGVPDSIEGTAFERTARELGTSTVSIVARISGYFIFILAVLVALTVADVGYIAQFWRRVVLFLPRLFTAVLVLIVGVVVADKVELLVDNRLRGVKLPEVSILPLAAKWSVFYIAALVALGQLEVDTDALVVLLAAYVFALVLFSALAFRDLLASGAAGVYLLLDQPYGIGDRVRIGDTEGIVQEVDVFVTRVETDDSEYVVPNRRAFTEGIVRVRE
ncbi:mechanosensitive ion channel domain-containing protein [Candidatus Halobonum tyrrellensis]|uniref:Mechanosensitive ion channel n=1 Tax=Candidatus Halobonum tyrrellensis G22 TaxID=1324957 RepID=V4HI88_9EURY|nr:mechanosensitive ion channel domain-containing protein [Candidatus Halobonum tyrrellensis]ESP89478.1 mechanosensitive ion channel [Candidatus Halobonum tyrrellensis G22]